MRLALYRENFLVLKFRIKIQENCPMPMVAEER